MKIIVGIGNPGIAYRHTRHNVGWQTLTLLARRHGFPRGRNRFNSRVAEGFVSGVPVLLLWPQTYVNASGEAVAPACHWYNISLEDLMVVCDDFNLELGRIRARRKGSSGGHKGIESIAQHLGTTDFPRLRIGIGVQGQPLDKEFVLSPFRREEKPIVEDAIARAADALETWVKCGIEEMMNRFN